jgi:hypothetical protein
MPPPVASAMPGARRARHQRIAAVDGEVLDGRRVDREVAGGVARLDFDDAGADVDRLRHRAELERDHADRQAVRRRSDDVGLFDGLERVHRDL